jgi:hypothetical protein
MTSAPGTAAAFGCGFIMLLLLAMALALAQEGL